MTPHFLWQMETILHLYHLPYDPMYPVVCFDERPCQLIDDSIAPIPMEPGRPKKEDYHYKRNGVASLFIAFEPLTGKRIVQVRPRRTQGGLCALFEAGGSTLPQRNQDSGGSG